MDNKKTPFFEKYIVTFFWLLFLLSSIPTLIFQIYEQKQYEVEMADYGKTVLVFDHAEDYEKPDKGKILVYKYDVEGEKYTYKTTEPTKDIPEEGTEIEYYYDKERPQEVVKKETKNLNESIGMIIFFGVIVVLSFIGANIGDGALSMILSFIPLCLLFVVVSIAMIFGSIYILVSGGGIIMFLFFGIMGLVFTPITILSEYKLIKELIDYCKNNKKRK